MGDLLIPFGIHRDTGDIVEPEDAPKGRACNCLCPGCKAPVLSRHPKQNRFHFAHDSRHELARPEAECPFNSAVAVAMMIRELAPSFTGKSFNTPDYQINLKHPCCGLKYDFIPISQSAAVRIDESSANVSVNSGHFDLRLIISGYPILVDLVYRGKPLVTLSEEELQAEKAGVLALDCDSFLAAALKKNRSKRFSEAVTDFVLKYGRRRWRYHPRQAAKLQAARESHQCRPKYNPFEFRRAGFKSTLNKPPPQKAVSQVMFSPEPVTKPQQASKRFYCVLCDLEWVHDFTGPLSCPGCQSHLYAREVGTA